MPRLPPSLLRQAAVCNRYLPRLLRECRDLESASNELRWLTDYAYDNKHHHATSAAANVRLMQYVRRRSTGEPLQYILGSQPFGELDILCRKNVLIPRPETELYTTQVAAALKGLHGGGVICDQKPVRIADLCTGTGCIALLLHALLRPPQPEAPEFPALHIFGADVSADALRLARNNQRQNIDTGTLHDSCNHEVTFNYLDVLDVSEKIKNASASTSNLTACLPLAETDLLRGEWEVVVSNPPYISPKDYAPGGTVGRSVRDHEPKLALVPPPLSGGNNHYNVDQADQFYEALIHIARKMQTKLLVMEVGDSAQADRVRRLVSDILGRDALIETWRDDGTVAQHSASLELQRSTPNLGTAHERAIVIWLAEWVGWRLKRTERG